MNRSSLDKQQNFDSGWHYEPETGFYDEMLQESGQIRGHWRGLTSSLSGLRDGEFAGLPAADEFLQAVEDAGENSRDQGVQGFGQHSPLVVQGGSGA